MRLLATVTLLTLITAGCTTPSEPEECVPLILSPDKAALDQRTPAVLRVELSNCGFTNMRVSTGPCGMDLLPRITVAGETYLLSDGGALKRAHYPCEDVKNATTTLEPGKTARITARWNGTLDTTRCTPPCPAVDFVRASPGIHVARVAIANETAEATVDVRR